MIQQNNCERHECNFCQKSYKKKQGLIRHIRFECSVSGGSRRFKCQYCNHVSQRADNLRSHVTAVHSSSSKPEIYPYKSQTMSMNYINDSFFYSETPNSNDQFVNL